MSETPVTPQTTPTSASLRTSVLPSAHQRWLPRPGAPTTRTRCAQECDSEEKGLASVQPGAGFHPRGGCAAKSRAVIRNYSLLTHPHHKCIFVVLSLCSDLSLYLISCTCTLSQSTWPQDKLICIYLGKKKRTLKRVLISQRTINTFS